MSNHSASTTSTATGRSTRWTRASFNHCSARAKRRETLAHERRLNALTPTALALPTTHGGNLPVLKLDAEMWHARITRMALIEVLATGRLSINSLETLAAMPAPMRETTLRTLSAARQVKDDREAMALIDQTALCLPK